MTFYVRTQTRNENILERENSSMNMRFTNRSTTNLKCYLMLIDDRIQEKV